MTLKSNNDDRASMPEDKLLSGLRANFVRAYSGDRARTASFINVNLAALGGVSGWKPTALMARTGI